MTVAHLRGGDRRATFALERDDVAGNRGNRQVGAAVCDRRQRGRRGGGQSQCSILPVRLRRNHREKQSLVQLDRDAILIRSRANLIRQSC